eukprot:781851-Amorphochlora_amoeboformis.AAC.1
MAALTIPNPNPNFHHSPNPNRIPNPNPNPNPNHNGDFRNVIAALSSEEKKWVPYRDSALTMLLKDSL